MTDEDCLENTRKECDDNPNCFGISWYERYVGQKLRLCLSEEIEPKNDGWRTMMKKQVLEYKNSRYKNIFKDATTYFC